MWRDPIVEETRRLREEYASSLSHDTVAICKDMKSREARAASPAVCLPPRRPRKGPASPS